MILVKEGASELSGLQRRHATVTEWQRLELSHDMLLLPVEPRSGFGLKSLLMKLEVSRTAISRPPYRAQPFYHDVDVVRVFCYEYSGAVSNNK